jgi:tetratricopeptide (TPR) repeat protein
VSEAKPSDELIRTLQPLLAGRADHALVAAQAARASALERGDEAAVICAMLVEGMAHDALGHTERDEVLAEALTRAQKLGDAVLLLRATNSQVVVDIYHGRYAVALSRGQGVLGLAHALQRPDLLGRLLNNLATVLDLIGEHAMSISIYNEWQALLVGDDEQTQLDRIRACNNEAEAWRCLARTMDSQSQRDGRVAALERARKLAEDACEQMLRLPYVGYRLSILDTLVSVLLDVGAADQAVRWVERVRCVDVDAVAPGTVHWGMFALVLSRVELEMLPCDPGLIVKRLRDVESLPGPRFKGGEVQAALHRCLAQALERAGDYRAALKYHRQWLQFEARTQSLWAREHAMAVHHTLDSLREETEEFITHDLRNPLRAALLHLGALADRVPNHAGLREAANGARLSVQCAADTADQYLVLVRARNLRRSSLTMIDLAELVDDAGESLAPPMGSAARLERDIEWGLDIRGDRILLLAAFDQLLRGALEASAGGGAVHWGLRAEGCAAVLSVEGDGLSWLDHVRMRHQQLSGAVLPGQKDMAAAMLSRIARLHDSRIDVITGPGLRARLEWSFPRVSGMAL